MDKARIEEIKARCEAATPGMWKRNGLAIKGPVHKKSDYPDGLIHIASISAGSNRIHAHMAGDGATVDMAGDGFSDAEFIAHAREDIPALVDALEMSDIEMHRQKALAVHNEGVKECRDARIEALERALKSHDPCISCVNHGKCPCRFDCFPISEARFYVFDEARFTKEAAE